MGFYTMDMLERREERRAEEAREKARERIKAAAEKFGSRFEAYVEGRSDEDTEALVQLLEARDEVVIAQMEQTRTQADWESIEVGGPIDPKELKQRFLDAGIRLVRVMRHDPDQEGNLGLLEAAIEGCQEIRVRDWDDVERAQAQSNGK